MVWKTSQGKIERENLLERKRVGAGIQNCPVIQAMKNGEQYIVLGVQTLEQVKVVCQNRKMSHQHTNGPEL